MILSFVCQSLYQAASWYHHVVDKCVSVVLVGLKFVAGQGNSDSLIFLFDIAIIADVFIFIFIFFNAEPTCETIETCIPSASAAGTKQ